VFPSVDKLFQIACHDLDPDFIESLAIGVAWGYSTLHDEIATEPGLPEDLRLEQFGRRRGFVVARALKRAADQHDIPYDFMRLDCNGQNKLLVKVGRVILIQEPILTTSDHPKVSDYKIKLASVHGLTHQSELDLGDRRRRIQDWSGCVLGVLLHGASGPNFSQKHRMLGSLMLGISDAAYSQWMLRADLHQIAMYGRGAIPRSHIIASAPEATESQPDNVIVTPKKKASDRGRA
jgi:hypothetical protein